MDEATGARRAAMQVNVIRLGDDHEAFDERLWAAVAPRDRLQAAIDLSVFLATMRGGGDVQQRFLRTVVGIQRGRR